MRITAEAVPSLVWALAVAVGLPVTPVPTYAVIEPIVSPEPGWPEWRGPLRDGISRVVK